MKLSLKTKLSLYIITSTLFIGIVVAYVSFLYVKNELINHHYHELAILSKKQSQSMSNLMTNGYSVTERMTSDASIINFINLQKKNTPQDAENMNKQLESYNIANSFSAIYIINADGLTLASTDRKFVKQNYGFRTYFQKAMANNRYVEAAVGVTSKELGYYFSRPIKNAGGEIIGAAVAKMRPDALNITMDISDFVPGTHLMLTDDNGIVIYSDLKNKIYKSLGTLDQPTRKTINEKRLFESIDIQPLGYEQLQQNIKNIKQQTILTFTDKEDNRQELIAVAQLENLPFFIIIDTDLGAIIQDARSININILLFKICAIIILAIFSYFTLSKMLKPIKTLKDAGERIKVMNFTEKINITSGDELQDLGESLNEISDKLNKYNYEFSNMVAEKTKKMKTTMQNLEKMNELSVEREIKMMGMKKELEKRNKKRNS
jgi:C4-dicarboxylate-specific signal transduction histidine kinase